MRTVELIVGAGRTFTAGDGVAWTVGEYARDGGGEHCLIFECDTAVRRVRRFPANWRDLGADSLLDLSWGR